MATPVWAPSLFGELRSLTLRGDWFSIGVCSFLSLSNLSLNFPSSFLSLPSFNPKPLPIILDKEFGNDLFCERFAAALPTIFAPAIVPASKPQPLLTPASIPKILSTIFGPSINATEKPINAIKYAKGLSNVFSKKAVPII